MPYSKDMWVSSVVIDSSNKKLRITESTSGVIDVTLEEGTYLLHNDTASFPHPGLYHAIEDVLGGSTTHGTASRPPAGTYAFDVTTPSLSGEMTNAGLELSNSGAGSETFSINWADTTNVTVNPRWFGFKRTSGTVGPTATMTSYYTVDGRWVSYTLHGNGAAAKTKNPYRRSRFSSERLSDAVATTWDTGHYRTMEYQWVPAAHLWTGRGAATDTAWANNHGLAAGDDLNSFETVWTALAQARDVVLVHDSIDALDLPSSDWEVVRLADARQGEEMMNLLTERRRAGGYYDLRVTLWVDPGYGGYDG